MLMRIFSLLGTLYPHRFCPQLSMRTLPLFSSVAHTPTGVVGAWTGAAATGDDAAWTAAAAAAGAVAAVDEDEGWVVVMISSLAAGAGALGATAADVDGADGCGKPPATVGGGAGAGGGAR